MKTPPTETSLSSSIAISLILISIFLVIFFSLPAFASEHGGTAEVEFLTFVINFTIFVGLLCFLLRKKIPAAWASRASKIEEEVTRNERALIAAQKELDSAKAELATLPSTISTITASIEKEQAEECAHIAADATESAKLATKRLAEIVDQETRAASTKFEDALSEEVLKIATAKLNSSWNETKDAKFCASSVLVEKTLSSLRSNSNSSKESTLK